MGDYKLKIGTSEFNKEIEGTDDWGQTVVRDFNDKILRIRGDYQFKGWQGLYDMLYTNTAVNGACNALTGKVYYRGDVAEAYSELWRGEMKPQDFEFDLIKESADGQILDNSWSARFNNSKDQSLFLRGTTSKNGVTIAECANIGCQFFDPTDSTPASYLGDLRLCFRIYEVFAYFVRYYTDGVATFASDFFDVGGDGDQYYITTGREIREHNLSANPEVSFSEVFDEMNKKLNLWIIIEGTQEAPVLRIEDRSYSLSETIAITVENPEGISLKTDLEQLYTEVNIGSNQTDFDTATYASYRNVPFTSWDDESYNTPGDCEFENNTLDLTSSWKIDTNSIEQALSVLIVNEEFDDDIFLIEIDPSTPFTAFKFTDAVTDITSPDAYFLYNFNLTNQQVLNNWFDALPQEIVKAVTKDYYMYVDDISALSGPAFPITLRFAVPFANDTVPPASDSDNLYDTGTVRATIEVSGLYDIDTLVQVTHPSSYTVTLSIVAYSSGGTSFVDDVLSIPVEKLTSVSGDQILNGSATTYLEAGWEVQIEVNVAVSDTLYYNNVGHFQLNAHTPVIQEGIDDPLIYIYDVSKFQLSNADFNTLTANKEKQVRFLDTKTGRAWNVWPKEMKYNHERQIAEGTFIGRSPLNELIDLCWVLDGPAGNGVWDDSCYWIDAKSWID